MPKDVAAEWTVDLSQRDRIRALDASKGWLYSARLILLCAHLNSRTYPREGM
jgi:hypothetical protein